MNRAAKLLAQMAANPFGDWTIADVECVCHEHGLVCLPPRGGGSHYKIVHPDCADVLTIPSRRPIKPVYIRDLVRMIGSVLRSMP